MPYDPTHPLDGEIVDADELRAKLDHAEARIDLANGRIDRGMSFTNGRRAISCRP